MSQDLEALFRTAIEKTAGQTRVVDGRSFAEISAERHVVDVSAMVEKHSPAPKNLTGTREVARVQSLIDLTIRHNDSDRSVIYCKTEESVPALTVVVNDDRHEAVPVGADLSASELRDWEPDLLPAWRDFRFQYTFPLSREWKAWKGISGTSLPQIRLASFLDEQVLDLLPPPQESEPADKSFIDLGRRLGAKYGTPDQIRAMVRALKVSKADDMESRYDPGTGGFVLSVDKSVKATSVDVPGLFLIGIPVVEGGDLYRLAVAVSYRSGNEGITFRLSLYRSDRVLDAVVTDAAEAVQKATGLPLIYGDPGRSRR